MGKEEENSKKGIFSRKVSISHQYFNLFAGKGLVRS